MASTLKRTLVLLAEQPKTALFSRVVREAIICPITTPSAAIPPSGTLPLIISKPIFKLRPNAVRLS
jgi:hypothetical protein